jgi:ribonuclease E
MVKRMLIDATHPEETRVVVMSGTRLDEFDYESKAKRQLKGNIYLAKVTRVEPSLQAAFVDYGGNRHGFLPFSEIHPDYYKIPIGLRNPPPNPSTEMAGMKTRLNPAAPTGKPPMARARPRTWIRKSRSTRSAATRPRKMPGAAPASCATTRSKK